MSVKIGQSFLILSGTTHNPTERHMFVVCTDVDTNGQIVLASISSWKNDLCDDTCRLSPGCHPFIKRDSYVLYRKSRIEFSETIELGLDKSVFVALDDVDNDTLEKIVNGLISSRHTPWQVKRHVKRQKQ